MGQKNSTTLSSEIEEQINNDSWQGFHSHSKVMVDLTQTEVRNPYKHKYIIKLESTVKTGNTGITLFFPNHPKEKLRVLRVSTTYEGYSVNKLSAEVNRRLKDSSSREGVMLAVAYDDTYFCFKNVVGNIYLLWTERLNVQTVNLPENTIEEEPVPLLVEKNGCNTYLSIYNFKFREFMSLEDTTIHEPIDVNVFCLEMDGRKDGTRKISVLSNTMSDTITKDKLVRQLISMDNEEPPFSAGLGSDSEIKILPSTARITNYYVPEPKRPDEEN